MVALRKESVDRNIQQVDHALGAGESLSARRAWIEIELLWGPACHHYVALRKESVDRNRARGFESYSCDVALRKESVDRNCKSLEQIYSLQMSLSARRAWIEIWLSTSWTG